MTICAVAWLTRTHPGHPWGSERFESAPPPAVRRPLPGGRGVDPGHGAGLGALGHQCRHRRPWPNVAKPALRRLPAAKGRW